MRPRGKINNLLAKEMTFSLAHTTFFLGILLFSRLSIWIRDVPPKASEPQCFLWPKIRAFSMRPRGKITHFLAKEMTFSLAHTTFFLGFFCSQGCRSGSGTRLPRPRSLNSFLGQKSGPSPCDLEEKSTIFMPGNDFFTCTQYLFYRFCCSKGCRSGSGTCLPWPQSLNAFFGQKAGPSPCDLEEKSTIFFAKEMTFSLANTTFFLGFFCSQGCRSGSGRHFQGLGASMLSLGSLEISSRLFFYLPKEVVETI